jgi:hypothetical protein
LTFSDRAIHPKPLGGLQDIRPGIFWERHAISKAFRAAGRFRLTRKQHWR